MKSNTRELVLCAIFAGVIAILSQIIIPVGTIPVTLQTLAIGLVGSLLGKKWGTICIFVYILLGLVFPVYAGGSMGIGVVFGPTGGYLIAFLPMAYIIGAMTEKKSTSFLKLTIANMIGSLITLTIGTIWLRFSLDLTWQAAFFAGAGIFIPIELAKAFGAASIVFTIKKSLPEKYEFVRE